MTFTYIIFHWLNNPTTGQPFINGSYVMFDAEDEDAEKARQLLVSRDSAAVSYKFHGFQTEEANIVGASHGPDFASSNDDMLEKLRLAKHTLLKLHHFFS